MSGLEQKLPTQNMKRWKEEKQIKKAKKIAIKQLVSEGSSVKLAKHLVNNAYKRIKK